MLRLRAHKRLSRTMESEAYAGYVIRDNQERQFGERQYKGLTGGAWFSSLLAPRTKLQISGEYQLTDTIRELTFTDVNTFSSDELGAFTNIDFEFAEVLPLLVAEVKHDLKLITHVEVKSCGVSGGRIHAEFQAARPTQDGNRRNGEAGTNSIDIKVSVQVVFDL
jgi:hypothetical protein